MPPLKVSKVSNVYSLIIGDNGTIYAGIYNGLWAINLLLKVNPFDYIAEIYNGFVYKKEQNIGIKNIYLKDTASLDGIIIKIPVTKKLTTGKHILILTLKVYI